MRGAWRACAAVVLATCGVASAFAQQCGFGTYQTFPAFTGQSPAHTVINSNNVYVGAARLQVQQQVFGSATLTTNDISASHYTGEPGIRVGHGQGTVPDEANRIQTTLHFRNPDDLTQYLPVSNLTFRLHDVDAGDRVRVNAYDQNGNLITLTSAHYTLYPSTLVAYAGGNLFQATDGTTDSLNNTRRGTVDINLSGLQVSRIEFRYWDPVASGTYTIAQMFGCNVPLTLYKTTQPGAGGPFGFTLTNTGLATGTVSTTEAGTPAQVDGNTATGMQPFTVATPGSTVTINENSLPTGWALTSATCTNAAGATVGSRSGSTYTLPGNATHAGSALTCTFTNTRTSLRLQKALPQGRAQPGDQFTLRISGGSATVNTTTTGTGTTATGMAHQALATPGTSYTLSELAAGTTVLAGYAASYSCTNSRPGGQTPSGDGTSFTVTPVVGDDLTCTFTNRPRQADLQVGKTAMPDPVLSGDIITYTVVATNNGPDPAPGAVLSDLPGAGLDCTVPDSTVTCTATGGATCPSATVPVATLLTSGMVVPIFPVGGQVTVTLRCQAVATGSP